MPFWINKHLIHSMANTKSIYSTPDKNQRQSFPNRRSGVAWVIQMYIFILIFKITVT